MINYSLDKGYSPEYKQSNINKIGFTGSFSFAVRSPSAIRLRKAVPIYTVHLWWNVEHYC